MKSALRGERRASESEWRPTGGAMPPNLPGRPSRFAGFALVIAAVLAAPIAAQQATCPTVEAGLWVVMPSAGGADLWHADFVTGEFRVIPLGPSFNGWGNLPSESISTIYHGANDASNQGDEPERSKFVSRWTDKNGLEVEITTLVPLGGSPEDHRRAMDQHNRDVERMCKMRPPAAKGSS